MNILWMLLHSVYFWSCACTLNALLGLGNLTNCLGGWNLTPECLYHHTVPSPLGNGNDCCKSPQGIHPTLYPNRYWWQLERTTDYDQANCKQYKFQHLAGLWNQQALVSPISNWKLIFWVRLLRLLVLFYLLSMHMWIAVTPVFT